MHGAVAQGSFACSVNDALPLPPDIEGLRNFSEQDDRSPAPVFVGRVGALADVEGAVRRVAAGDAQGGVRLVYGAPGAGKSALLEELAARWRAREARDAPIPLFVSADDFAEPALVAEAILDALNPGATSFSASTRRTAWSARAGFLSRRVENGDIPGFPARRGLRWAAQSLGDASRVCAAAGLARTGDSAHRRSPGHDG